MPRLRETRRGVLHQVGILRFFAQHLPHPLEDFGMNVARALPEIGGDLALDLLAVDHVPLVVDLLHHPDLSGDGDFLARRRRQTDGAQLVRTAAHGVFLVLLKHRVELVGRGQPLARQPDDQPARLGPLDVLGFEQMSQQQLEVVLRDAVEVAQRQHARGQRRRRHLPAGSQRTHRLMIQQAVWQPVELGRLHPALLQIHLYERDALKQLPRDGRRQHRARLGLLLAHHEPHLRRQVAPPRPAHPL